MILLAGLGNPGKEYEKTRHNVGFLVIDAIQKKLFFPEMENQKKFNATLSVGKIGKEKILLAEPQTFMNNSGKSIVAISKFYKIKPENIWIIHDDADLPFETMKISKNKSSGGHRGVQSIIKTLKTQNFIRFRIGIKSTKSGKVPSRSSKFMGHFLVEQKFSAAQQESLKKIIKKCIESIEVAATESLDKAMTNFN
jgi:PTH1 family peptidyl-tRNA hydrolase